MNIMKLNPIKSKCMQVTNYKNSHIKIFISMKPYFVDTHTLTGVKTNKNLKWNPHISFIFNKMMSRIYLLKRLTFNHTFDKNNFL